MNPDHPEFPGAARGRYLSNTEVKQIIGDGAEIANKLLEDSLEPNPVLVYVDGEHSTFELMHE